MSSQLLEAVQFFHDAGVVHGDISPGNIVFTCKNDVDSEEKLFYKLNRGLLKADYTDEEPWTPDLPKHLVQYATWPGWYEAVNEELRLIDMGSSFPFGETVTSVAQPTGLRSPETIFVGSLDYHHDWWKAGCAIYFLYYQKSPFVVYGNNAAFYISKLVLKLGPLPDDWHSIWEEMRKQSAPDDRQFLPELITDTFDARRDLIMSACNNDDADYERDEHTDYDCEALKCLLPVMEGLLRYKPNKRLSPTEAVQCIQSAWTDYRMIELDTESLDDGAELDEQSS